MRVIETSDDEVGVVMTREEAQVLADICGRIGGSPATTRRGLFDIIHRALRDAGIHGTNRNDFDPSYSSQIYFKNGTYP
jgi:hypothetical protein